MHLYCIYSLREINKPHNAAENIRIVYRLLQQPVQSGSDSC